MLGVGSAGLLLARVVQLRPRPGDATVLAVQGADPDSVLAAYRRLLLFRRTAPALRIGSMERLADPDPDVLAWTRSTDTGC